MFLKRHPETDKWCYLPLANWPQVITQSCQALPLYAEIVPEEAKQDVIETFIESVQSRGSLWCGEIGLRFVILMLDRLGQQELLSTVIMRDEHPSYWRFVKMGETSLPEFWHDDARSKNHDMLGHIMEWFYSGMSGVTSEEDAFKKISISPWMPHDMNELKCAYDSIRGTIAIEMRRTDNNLTAKISVPEGSSATVDFRKMFTVYTIQGGDTELTLKSGVHEITVLGT